MPVGKVSVRENIQLALEGLVSIRSVIKKICVCVCVFSASAVKQEVKVEQAQAPPSSSNTDLVTVAITLNPVAAQVKMNLSPSV